MLSRSIGASALLGLVWLSSPIAVAQDCGEMSEFQCAILLTSIKNWNGQLGENVRIQEWKYLDRSDNVSETLDLVTSEEHAWFPDQSAEGNIVGAVSLQSIREKQFFTESVLEQMENRWRGDIAGVLQREGMKSLVQLQWEQGGEFFSTIAVLTDTYPFLYDTMLSNAFLTYQSNSCENMKVLWLWGWTRGEIIVDVAPMWSGSSKSCNRLVRAWMQLGSVEHEMSGVEYDGDICRFRYAYAFTSPMASASFDQAGFKFDVSGIGSYKTGAGDCADASEGP